MEGARWNIKDQHMVNEHNCDLDFGSSDPENADDPESSEDFGSVEEPVEPPKKEPVSEDVE